MFSDWLFVNLIVKEVDRLPVESTMCRINVFLYANLNFFALFSLLCTVSPTYDLSDFLIESAPLRRQLEQETILYEYEKSKSLTRFCPTKHQLVRCLAVRGQWVTSQPKLQLDPPDSHMLMMKGASLHFLFEPTWLLSGAQHGDYLQVLQSTMSKLEDGTIK